MHNKTDVGDVFHFPFFLAIIIHRDPMIISIGLNQHAHAGGCPSNLWYIFDAHVNRKSSYSHFPSPPSSIVIIPGQSNITPRIHARYDMIISNEAETARLAVLEVMLRHCLSNGGAVSNTHLPELCCPLLLEWSVTVG